MLLACAIHPANLSDNVGAHRVLEGIHARYPDLRHLWADAGYRGSLIGWAQTAEGLTIEIVQRPVARADQPPGPTFQPVKHRWVVERTFAWLSRNRRLTRDYEGLADTTTSLIHIAMIRLMLARLARP